MSLKNIYLLILIEKCCVLFDLGTEFLYLFGGDLVRNTCVLL
jgi:hypothetical protein